MFTNQNRTTNKIFFMRLAIAQAQKNLGNTKENPSVGCVITSSNTLISAGCTSTTGRPHAEKNTIGQCKVNLKDSELYVTLEPCSHYGKTPPCTKLIIKNRIKKVFFSINDPDERSNNKCIKILKSKKIIVNKGICSSQLNYFYRSYIKSKKNFFPFVTSKMAMSKDFFTVNKNRKWITNEYSRGRVHLLRSNHDCIMTSADTIIKDDSRLTCRINGLQNKSPTRIILDRKLKLPLKSKIFNDANRFNTIIFYNKEDRIKIKSLKKMRVKFIKISLNKNGNLDLKEVLIKARKMGFCRIFLESGLKLTFVFFKSGLIDDFKLFISNKKLGKNGRGSIKKYFNIYLKNKKHITEKVYLFGEKLITYKVK